MTFDDLFERATGFAPFPFQQALAEGPWPDLLTVPTGSGKTAAVVVAWLWRRRFARTGTHPETPRRLVYCLPTRGLVEQTVAVAQHTIAGAGLAEEIGVHALLGGAVDNAWEAAPDREQVLVGTQDQLLSRALNRGYASSRYRWPIQFGFLHSDSLWVFDETQLMGVGLSTGTQLQALRDKLQSAAPTHSLFVSATNRPGPLATVDFRCRELVTLTLGDGDRGHPVLARRIAASKALDRLDAEEPKAIAVAVAAAHQPGSRSLVVVNTVRRAQDLFKALQKVCPDAAVRLLHSRLRPPDRASASDALRPDFDGIVVATQVVEAGVDLSARLLVTEIAPWASLVQRAGRCNRGGEFGPGEAQILWIDLPDKSAAPYDPSDLDEARQTLEGLDDLGVGTVEAVPLADLGPTRPVLRRKDLLDLFDTEPDLAGEHIDVSRFVRDSNDRDVQVAWRVVGDKPGDETALPHRDELCRVPVGALHKLLKTAVGWTWDALEGSWQASKRPSPGQVVLLDVTTGGYDDLLGWTGQAKHRPTPIDAANVVPDADESDRWTTHLGVYVALTVHHDDVVAEVATLQRGLPSWDAPWQTLATAARWHDLGKVHPAFQEMLLSGLEDDSPLRDNGPYAKSDGRNRSRCRRRHFRHELPSALGWLAAGGDDLTAYFVAAHHGKVRLHLRPRPSEPLEVEGRSVVLGVVDGEVLPAAELGGGVRSATVPLDLSIARLGGGDAGPAWSHRTTALLDQFGPFRLAAWEALLRVADWRGSRRRAPSRQAETLEVGHD